jgi:hypothetical protein
MTMKKVKFFIALFVLICIGLAHAQGPIDKGSMLIGGEFAFNSDGGDLFENADDDRITRIAVDCPVGYFLFPGFVLGVRGAYMRTSQGDWSSTEWGVGPQLLYFFGKTGDQAKGSTYPFLRTIFLYSQISEGSDNKTKWTGTLLEFGGGVVHMLTESVGLVGSAGYQMLNFKPEDGESESGNRIRANVGFVFFLY